METAFDIARKEGIQVNVNISSNNYSSSNNNNENNTVSTPQRGGGMGSEATDKFENTGNNGATYQTIDKASETDSKINSWYENVDNDRIELNNTKESNLNKADLNIEKFNNDLTLAENKVFKTHNQLGALNRNVYNEGDTTRVSTIGDKSMSLAEQTEKGIGHLGEQAARVKVGSVSNVWEKEELLDQHIGGSSRDRVVMADNEDSGILSKDGIEEELKQAQVEEEKLKLEEEEEKKRLEEIELAKSGESNSLLNLL